MAEVKDKNELIKKEEDNLVQLANQSGIENAIEKLILKNNSLLPNNVAVERIKNSAGFYISHNESLMSLNKEGQLQTLYGVLKEAMVGCEAGLDYDIIPYKNKPTVVRKKEGWWKIIDLIKPAEIVRFTNNVVFKGDEFSFNPVTEEIRHNPKVTSDKYEDIEYAYAYIKFANGFEKTVVMSKKDLDSIKKVSPSSSSTYSPWTTMPVKMVKTKIVKELAKELFTIFSGRVNAVLASVIENDEQVVARIDSKGYIQNDKSIYDAKVEEPKKVSLKDIE